MATATLRLKCVSGYHDYRHFEVIVERNPDFDLGGSRYINYLRGEYCDSNYCVYKDFLCCFEDPGQAMDAKDVLESMLKLLEQGMEPDSALDKLTEDFPDLDVRGLLDKCGYVPGEGVPAT